MGQPLPPFLLSDPHTTDLGWKMIVPQTTVGAHVYVNNQSAIEFDVYGNGTSYLGKVPAWLTYADLQLRDLFSYLDFRPVANLNVLGAPANYVSAMFFEANESQPSIGPIAVVRQTDIARQQRVVSVPMALSHWVQGRWLDTDPSVVTFSTAFISAGQLASGKRIAPIYLYYANCVPEADISAGMTFLIQLQWQDNLSNNLGGPFVFARGGVIANATNLTTTPWTFAPVSPFGAVGQFPVGATKALLQIAYQNGGRLKIDYSIGMWMDQTNSLGVSDIGTQAIYNSLFPAVNPYF